MRSENPLAARRGFWVILLFLLGVPFLFWLLVASLIHYYQPQFARLNPASARFIGLGLGSLYHGCCILAGLLKQPWHALVDRVKEFFANLLCSPSFAFSCYWEDLKDDGGPIFLIYAIIIGGCLYLSIDGCISFLTHL